ncbi:hypothetical protein LZ32DRAFT_605451 [Colletotrichum eremochloae]|nr:hypothetical protein LZ32DRAFT_605451 [Colletotrichum eremochloae]
MAFVTLQCTWFAREHDPRKASNKGARALQLLCYGRLLSAEFRQYEYTFTFAWLAGSSV